MKRPVNLQSFDEAPRRLDVEDRLGDEGARQCDTVLRWQAWKAGHGWQEKFEAHELNDRDKWPLSLSWRLSRTP